MDRTRAKIEWVVSLCCHAGIGRLCFGLDQSYCHKDANYSNLPDPVEDKAILYNDLYELKLF